MRGGELISYDPPLAERSQYLRLDFNENILEPPEEMTSLFREIPVDVLSRYPDYSELNRAISEFFSIETDEFIVVNGTDEGIRQVITTFVSESDTVSIPVPSFSMYEFYSVIRGAEIARIPLLGDLSYAYMDYLSTSARLVFICSPNNPTGTEFPVSVLREICERNPDTIYVLDQAYEMNQDKLLVFRQCPNLLVLRTFSKQYAMAGLRIGFIAGDKSLIAELKRTNSPYPVNAVAAILLPKILGMPWFREYANVISENRCYLRSELRNRGFEVVPSSANFLLVNFGAINSFVNAQLKQRGILIRNRSSDPMLEGYSRITIGSREQMDTLIRALDEILSTPTILFDMDGVLVDVTDSYWRTISETVERLSGRLIGRDMITSVKSMPGYNNDWKVTQKILHDAGTEFTLDEIIPVFQSIYEVYSTSEKLIPSRELLSSLSDKYRLGVVTGRPRAEALSTLQRLDIGVYFSCVVGLEDVSADKPDPEGILKAVKMLYARDTYYVGDTINDVKAALRAGVTPVVFPRQEQLSCTIQLSSLSELEELL